MKRTVIFKIGLALVLFIIWAGQAPAQIPVPPPTATAPIRSPAELDQLLGPIALYPDPLIAEILPAATLPSEIVMADRYVRGGGDPNLIDQQPWDPSIKALARYPSVLAWMDDNLAWTTDTGQAFLNQEADVMNSVQRLRSEALALGNLQTTPQQTVENDNGLLEILPANPEVIYVPVYQPQQVYYLRPPRPGFFFSFGIGFPVGIWLNHDFDWRDRRVIVWRHDHPRPRDWWAIPPSRRPVVVQGSTVWHPRVRPPLGLPDRGDRGWQHQAPLVVTPRPGPPIRREAPVPTPAPHVGRPRVQNPSGPLIGVHSAPETRQFSQRGQQSRGTIARPPAAPPVRPAAPATHPPSERNRR